MLNFQAELRKARSRELAQGSTQGLFCHERFGGEVLSSRSRMQEVYAFRLFVPILK